MEGSTINEMTSGINGLDELKSGLMKPGKFTPSFPGEQENSTVGDGLGISLYYCVFCVGTLASCFMLYTLDDKRVIDRNYKIEERKKQADGQIELQNFAGN